MAQLTPMMRQYLELKEANPDALLFFRLGDFYEMFFEDAEIAARELELTLTGRDCGLKERAPMCGVPWHAVDSYIARLISRGYKVAIAEQTEEPGKGKTLVKREVVRIITPGTFSDTAALSQKQNRFIAAVYFAGKRAGVALCDVSTGEFFLRGFEKADGAAAFLQNQQPSEAISNDAGRLKDVFPGYISQVRPEIFNKRRAQDAINAQFDTVSPEAVGIPARSDLLVCPSGALLHYLNETQMVALKHITRVQVLRGEETMPLPPTTRRSLELVERLNGQSGRGTLLKELDQTRTAMGARLLRSFVERPLIDLDEINDRLDCVEALAGDPLLLEETGALLKDVYDLERLLGKLSYRTLGPRDCLAMLRSLNQAPQAQKMLEKLSQTGFITLKEQLKPQPELADLLTRAIDPDAPVALSDGGVIRKGYSAELDEARLAARDGRTWISNLEAKEREQTGIKNLRVQYNRVFGYFFEVTRSYYHMVPEHFIRRQTLANAERFTTQELNDLERKALGAQEEADRLESLMYNGLLDALFHHVLALQDLALGFKTLDALQSLARVAQSKRYVRPVMNTEGRLHIINGRHPVVETAMPEGGFVPNDVQMDAQDRVLIVTGPNMSGKSTYMRQTALICLMAHMGSFVPADSAQIPLLDNVFTRIGAQDDLAAGQSTFMVEMIELSHILRNATPRSLVVLDEVGRGTGTLDGLSIAWAAVEYLADPEKSGALTLFATHYHELSEMEGALPGVVNLSVLTREMGDEVIFLHKIQRGGADKSFGVYVARMAGVPHGVVARAREILARLEASNITQDEIGKNILEKKGKKKNEQMALTDFKRVELLDELAKLDVLQMSPMEALNELFVLKEKARKL
ncbi:MAG: DNA mismatch repair protein MutS [Clostridiales bacterium]|nr:DNA mismatch repair protein MutS [Clostridiales bacterium]